MIADKFPGHKFGPHGGSAEKSQEMAKYLLRLIVQDQSGGLAHAAIKEFKCAFYSRFLLLVVPNLIPYFAAAPWVKLLKRTLNKQRCTVFSC